MFPFSKNDLPEKFERDIREEKKRGKEKDDSITGNTHVKRQGNRCRTDESPQETDKQEEAEKEKETENINEKEEQQKRRQKQQKQEAEEEAEKKSKKETEKKTEKKAKAELNFATIYRFFRRF